MEKENRPFGWTTLEESKRLFEAGLDPNTADMSYNWVECRVVNGNPKEDWLLQPFPPDDNQPHEQLPCWSLGALKKFIPDEIKVNDVWFYFYCSYNWIRKWCASYVDENFSRLVRFNMFSSQIEMFNQIVLFLLENNHIKKHE